MRAGKAHGGSVKGAHARRHTCTAQLQDSSCQACGDGKFTVYTGGKGEPLRDVTEAAVPLLDVNFKKCALTVVCTLG